MESAIPLHCQLRTPSTDLGFHSDPPEEIDIVFAALGIRWPKLQNQHAQVASGPVREGVLELRIVQLLEQLDIVIDRGQGCEDPEIPDLAYHWR